MGVQQVAETFRLFTGVTADLRRKQRVFAEAVALRVRSLAEAG
jgi:hypothetical protein